MANDAGVQIVGTRDDYRLRVWVGDQMQDVPLSPNMALNLIADASKALRVILNEKIEVAPSPDHSGHRDPSRYIDLHGGV